MGADSAKSARTCLTIVLAAGEGTRMRSSRPKVLHEVAGRSLLGHVLNTVCSAASTAISVVVGPDSDSTSVATRLFAPDARIFEQRERKGTAHAVLAARPAIEQGADDILIVFGDTPLVRPETLTRLRAALADGAAVAVLGFRAADPTGYGRLVTRGDELIGIVEHKDATPAERDIKLCNAGLMALDGARAPSNAITPALHSVTLRSSGVESACSRIATRRPCSSSSRP